MEVFGLISLFGILLLLAAIPSGSVSFVVVSAATRGLPCGIAASLGIVAGDLIFVTLALLGMVSLAESMGAVFAVLRFLGGGYLIWLGIGLIRSVRNAELLPAPASRLRMLGTFHAALLLTLGDLKAILFYASLFPLCIDLENLTAGGIVLIISLTAISVGSVKIAYAVLANRIVARYARTKLWKGSRIAAGAVMIGAGSLVIAKT
jgi:threonine/homoserine/homoserine lactone efflux protein